MTPCGQGEFYWLDAKATRSGYNIGMTWLELVSRSSRNEK